MATISSRAIHIAAVAALLLSGIGVGLSIDSTRAEDGCASAPGAGAPAGQHWYYRIDRVKQRKCWYLHATVPLANHFAAKQRAVPAEPAASVATPQLPFDATPQLSLAAAPQAAQAASAPQPAADSPSEAVSNQPAPHVTVLAVRPVPALLVGTLSASQAATPEQAGEPPVPQISANNANVPADAVAKPARGASPASISAATDSDHNALVPAATASARTQSADLFFLLALALGISAALILLCGKLAGLRRTPRLSEHPDDAWRRTIHEEDAPLLAPEEPLGPADFDAHERIERSPPTQAQSPAARPKDGQPAQSDRLGPILKDIELALHAMRQTRQSITQT